MGRTAYYSRMGVMPDSENEAYFLTTSWAKIGTAPSRPLD